MIQSPTPDRVQDAAGDWWVTVRRAVTDTGKARPTIMSWIGGGTLITERVDGRIWIRERELYKQARRAAKNARTRTRAANAT